MMFRRFSLTFPAAFALCGISFCSNVAQAAVILDPTNDFLAGYIGPQNPDLDVVQAEVTYDGSSFLFNSILNGNIGVTPGAFYVWGINRGMGTASFGLLAPGVLFDSVVILNPSGASSVRDLISSVSTPIAPSLVTVNGADLSVRVNASLLPSEGFQPQSYTVNLWPRLAGGTNEIADFAPNNSNALVTTTPEPASFALLGGALALAGVRRWKRAYKG